MSHYNTRNNKENIFAPISSNIPVSILYCKYDLLDVAIMIYSNIKSLDFTIYFFIAYEIAFIYKNIIITYLLRTLWVFSFPLPYVTILSTFC